MNRALQDRRATRRKVDGANEEREDQQGRLLWREPEGDALTKHKRRDAHNWNGQADGRDRRTES